MQTPWVDRPPDTPSIRRQGQIASQLQDSRYEPATRQSVAVKRHLCRHPFVSTIVELSFLASARTLNPGEVRRAQDMVWRGRIPFRGVGSDGAAP